MERQPTQQIHHDGMGGVDVAPAPEMPAIAQPMFPGNQLFDWLPGFRMQVVHRPRHGHWPMVPNDWVYCLLSRGVSIINTCKQKIRFGACKKSFPTSQRK